LPVVVDLSTGKYIYLSDYVDSIDYCAWGGGDLTIACITLLPPENGHIHSAITLVDVQGHILRTIPLPIRIGRFPTLVWSPDNKQVAIGHEVDGDLMAQKTWTDILSLDTGNIVESFASGDPSDWSVDGSWLLTVERAQDEGGGELPHTISVVNVKSGESTQIAEGTRPLWQPSGVAPVVLNAGSEPASTSEVSSSAAPFSSDVSITLEKTLQGNMLHIQVADQQYEIGPLEGGIYAIGPNKKFFVYATNSGNVYAARIGDKNLILVGDVKDFSIIRRGEAPQYDLEFFGDNPYTVQIRELILKQDKTLSIPHYISAEN
jgi:hypothetical protein